MTNSIKIICFFLPLCLLLSCNKPEEEDYCPVLGLIHNDILVDVLDFEGNKLIDSNFIVNNLAFIRSDGYNIPFDMDKVGEEKLIKTCFPPPTISAMRYSDDRNSGYGESKLIVKVNDRKYTLRGSFHCTNSFPDIEIFACVPIKIIGIQSDHPEISVSEYADRLKVTIKIASK